MKIEKINIEITENFEDEIENIMLEKSIISEDDMVFRGRTVGGTAFRSKDEEIQFIKENIDIIFFDETYVYLVKKDEVDNDYSVERFKIDSTYGKLLESSTSVEDSTSIKITGIKPVEMPGIVSGDYSSSINDLFVDVEFTNNISVRVAVDMDFEDIDFENPKSISETMLKEAWNEAYIQYAQNLIDEEVITGEFGFDYEIEDPEEFETYSIKDSGVSGFYNIINMIPPKERGYVAKRLLEVKGVLKNDDSEDNDSESENKIYLVNAFTPNMLDIETIASGFNVEFTPISKEEGLNIMTDSAIGHEDFAELLGVPYNRINLTLKRGDVFILAQRVGERLPEGTTTLTEDVNVVFLKGVVQ